MQEVCRAIWDSLVGDYMPVPTKQDWRDIAEGFSQRWNFPNCLGSVDGKHVVIQAPSNSGSLFHNYKGTYSIVLLAVVDYDYRFRVIDVGSYGRSSDGGTLANSAFGQALKSGTLDLPEDCPIPAAEGLGPMPHVFVGDEAFPLQKNLMRPFPGRNLTRERRMFNYRLSRARLTVECAFGILSSQWRMYQRVIGVCPEKAEMCVKATCVLHNFLKKSTTSRARPGPTMEGESTALLDAPRTGSNNAAREAIRSRESFCTYFNAEGEVSWQRNVV